MKIKDILSGTTKRRAGRGPRVKRLLQKELIIREGGNVFADAQPFAHEMIPNIIATVNKVLSQTGAKAIPIGSGATPTPGKVSGDLDLIVDQDTLAREFKLQDPKLIRKQLRQVFDLAGLQTGQSGVSVHVRVPMEDHSHQVDIMVVPDAADVSKFHTHSIPQGSPFKGVNKHIAMSYLAKQQGLKWSGFKGLLRREDDSMVSKDVNDVAKILLGPTATANDLGSVEAIMNALPDKGQQMIADLRADPNWKELS